MGEKGSVYFVQGESGGPIKIGYTTNMKRRIILLQNGYPEKLVVLALTPGTKETEEVIHIELQKHRLHGEWFAPHAEVLKKVAEAGVREDTEDIKESRCYIKTHTILKTKEIDIQKQNGLTLEEMGCLAFLSLYIQPHTGRLICGRNKRNMKYQDILSVLNQGRKKTDRIIKSLKKKGFLFYDKGYYLACDFIL